MPVPLPLVAIERASGSVNETWWSNAFSTWRSIPLRNCIWLRRAVIFSLRRFALASANVAFFAIRPVERGEIASDAGVDLLHAFLDLGHRVVLVAIVHGLEFAAVDGDDGVGEKVQTTAQCNKLAAHRPDRRAVVA